MDHLSRLTLINAVIESNVRFWEKSGGSAEARLSYRTQLVVIARDIPNKRALLGGVGVMGVGMMWTDELPTHANLVGWENAPQMSEVV